MKKRILMAVWILLPILLPFVLDVNSNASGQDIPGVAHLVRSLEADETGIVNPAGLAYSIQDGSFQVLSATPTGQPQAALMVVQRVNLFAQPAGASSLPAAFSDPINVAFDNNAGSLLLYQASASRLIEVGVDATGNLHSADFNILDFRRFGIRSAQGLSVDSANGDLFLLDGEGLRIFHFKRSNTSGFDLAAAPLSLSNLNVKNLRGLAVDPTGGNLFILDPAALNLYEISLTGKVLSQRDLSIFGIVNPQGIVFAPSGDQTDDPAVTSLYLADSGATTGSAALAPALSSSRRIDPLLSSESTQFQSSGQIVEISLLEVGPVDPTAFTSSQVAVRDLALLSPPIPDPTGMTYISTRGTLLISDSEVEEIVSGITHFQGANIWEVTLTGSLVDTANISSLGSAFPFSNEPSGVAYNPSNGHYYFTDDNTDKMYDLNPGTDAQIGTADDILISFNLNPYGIYDPEGITFDNANDVLYLTDGVNAEVYQFSLDGNLISQFDVRQFGVQNPNSLDFNSHSQTLFVLSNGTNEIIAETTLDGELLRTIDLNPIPLLSPDSMAYAPASDESGIYRFYISDRGVDNNTDPTIIDGKIYELTAPAPITPGNQPIIVNAGPDQSITLPTNSVLLDASVIDDSVPIPVTTVWNQISGACLVTFGDPAAIDTSAAFPHNGRYELRLDASDGELNAWDSLVVDVHRQTPVRVFNAYLEARWDDAEENNAGSVRREGTQIELGEYQGPQTDGFRFNWLDIPPGAKIVNAYIQYAAKAVSSAPVSLTIRGQAADNAATFANVLFDISSRPTTTAAVDWSPDPWTILNEQGADQRTPELSSLLQEIVDRPGWTSGNSAAFIITGSGTRSVHGYESDPCLAAYLHVEWDLKITAGDDSYSTPEDTALVVAAPGVLTNDTDPDGAALTAQLLTSPTNGELVLNPDGSFTYTPDVNNTGSDSFTYAANNGDFDSDPATVTITVTPVNDPPVVVNDTAIVIEDSQENIIAVLGNDSDPDGDVLSVVAVGQAGHGVVTLVGGVVRYSPEPNYFGTDSFSYTVSDGLLTGEGIVNLTISGVNDPPVAVDDFAFLNVNSTDNIIDVLANDTDVEIGTILSVTAVGNATHGTVVLSAGVVRYSPEQDFFGQDAFSYTVSDGELTDQGVVTINVGNHSPLAVTDEYGVYINRALTVPAPQGVLKNDSDPDIGDNLIAVLVDSPTHGDLVFTNDGSFTYVPDAGFYGSDGFSYKAFDGTAFSEIVSVTIFVRIPIFLPLLIR